MTPWINQRRCLYWYDQYALNEQETAFAKYDPDRIAAEMAETGAQIVAVYAANQFGIAYYPSRVWPQHPRLNGRDYFGEVASRLRKRGIKVIAYVNWLDSKNAAENLLPLEQAGRPHFAEQPLASWAEPSKPNGRIQALPGGGWRHICLNSPHRAQIVAITREIVERYHPDAFHVDMVVNPAVCICPSCRPVLEKLCGTQDLDRAAVTAHWTEYIDWRCERSASFIAEVSAILRPHGVVAAHNGMAPLFCPAIIGIDEPWLPALDVYLSECFDAFRYPTADLHATSLNVRWQHAVGKPAWILRTSTPNHHAHWPISPAQWELHAAACKANGAKAFGPCGVGAYPDTTSPRRLLDGVRQAFAFYLRDADLDEGARPVAKVALVFSWATRRYFGPDSSVFDWDLRPEFWSAELAGWGKFLIEEHIPFEFQVAEGLTAAQLASYELVILPNAVNLDERGCAVIAEYVRAGGKVLATGETSLRTERNGKRNDFALAEVLGVSHRGAVTGPFAIERPVEPEPVAGAFQQVAATGQVVARRFDVDPAGSVGGKPILDPLPVTRTNWPVVVRNRYGRGQTGYVAFEIGRSYQAHGDLHLEALMREQVNALLPVRPLHTTAPRTVEITVWRQPAPERTVLHFANRTTAATTCDTRHIAAIIPVHGLEVALPQPYPGCRVSARQTQVHGREQDGQLTITLERLEAYAAAVIEPSRETA